MLAYTNEKQLKSDEAYNHGKKHYLAKHHHREYILQSFAILDEGLMLLHTIPQLLVATVLVTRCIAPSFIRHQILQSVLQYAELAGNVKIHDAQQIVETNVTGGHVIHAKYLYWNHLRLVWTKIFNYNISINIYLIDVFNYLDIFVNVWRYFKGVFANGDNKIEICICTCIMKSSSK